MKVVYFQQVPYRTLPEGFEQHHESAVTPPWSLTTPAGVRAAFADAIGEMMHAARAGFDGIAVTEHSQSSYDMSPNPDLTLAALAVMTEAEGLPTALVGVGRSLGKSREPLRVAEELAVVDALSGGRVVAGFPIGLAYDASVNNGVPPAEVRPRFFENLQLVLRAWTAPEPFAHNGRFSQHPQVNLWPRPVQDPHPPVWMTGIGNPATMAHVLDHDMGFNYFGWFGARLTGERVFGRLWDIAEQKGLPANPHRAGFMQPIAVADTDAEAERLYARHVETFFRTSVGAMGMERLALPGGIVIRGVEAIIRDPGDFGIYHRMRTATFAELMEAGAIVCGSPTTVRDQLTEWLTDFRVANLHAMLQFGSMPTDLARHNIDLFAREVMPALRELWPQEDHPHRWWPEALGGTRSTGSALVAAGVGQ